MKRYDNAGMHPCGSFCCEGRKRVNYGEHLGAKPYDETWDSNAINGDWDFIDYTERRASGAALKLAINGEGDAAANGANWRKAA